MLLIRARETVKEMTTISKVVGRCCKRAYDLEPIGSGIGME